MAYIQGSNTGLENVFADLITFLTTSQDLIDAGEVWTQVSTYDTADTWGAGVYLRSPSISGEYFYVLISRRTYNSARHILFQTFKDIDLTDCQTIRGGTNYVMKTHPTMITMDDTNPCNYLFVASARRITGTFETLGYYYSFYSGLFWPYTTPDYYPYPMVNMGGVNYFGHMPTTNDGSSFNSFYNKYAFIWGTNYRDQDTYDSRWAAGVTTGTNNIYQTFYTDEGHWTSFSAYKAVSDDDDNNIHRMWPHYYEDGGQNVYLHDFRVSPGGSVPLLPCVLYRNTNLNTAPKTYGELDGVKHAPHKDVDPGDLVTDANGHQWLIVSNGMDSWRKAAIRLL